MVHGLDTGFLVAAEVVEHANHAAARQTLARLVAAGDRVAIAPQILAEFIHVVTDPRRFAQPLQMDDARHLAQQWWTAREVDRVFPNALISVNQPLLETLSPGDVEVIIRQADEAEMDEMWSYVQRKDEPRWLWHAIDHRSGKVLAYVFGRRKDEAFLKLKALLEPFGITRYYTDYWGAYTRYLDTDEHEPGKRNTQKIERKHLTLRTRIKRLARKTICFSKSIQMHDIVIGLFVNRYEFGLLL